MRVREKNALCSRSWSSRRRDSSFVVGWSCICAWYADRLREEADQEPGGRAETWLGWIGEVNVRVIGSLFIFSLVFRFNHGGRVESCGDS